MGNGSCCAYSKRVNTLSLDEISDSQPFQDDTNRKEICSPRISSPGVECQVQYIQCKSLKKKKNQPQLLSTSSQSLQFQTLSSEQHFSNFITFQAIPSLRDLHSKKLIKNKSNFLQEINEIQIQMSSDQDK